MMDKDSYRAPKPTRRQPHGSPTATFALPAMLLVVGIYLIPLLWNLATSFTNQTTFKSTFQLVGWENYILLFNDGQFMRGLRVTIAFALLVVIIDNVMALGLAMLLARATLFNKVMRTVFFVPVLISSLAAGYIFRAFLTPDGLVNRVISLFTVNEVNFEWLAHPQAALAWAAFTQSWRFFGVHMLIYIAAINAIPGELLQSARVDGASAIRTFLHVTWPLIAGAVTVNVVLTLTGGLQIFDVVLALTGGGPGRSTEVLNILVWQKFGQGDMGLATAISAVLVACIALAAFPILGWLRRREVQL